MDTYSVWEVVTGLQIIFKARCQQGIPAGQISTAPTITITCMSDHEVGFLCVHTLFQGNVLGLWPVNRADGDCFEWDFSKRYVSFKETLVFLYISYTVQ